MPDLLDTFDIGGEIYREPGRLVAPHAWEGHIPFAYWLIKVLRPSCLVELGTHSGNSYFAMCEAIELSGCGGRAYAVDTWEGDEHAGFYGSDVYDAVNAHNEGHFSSFSTLMRMLFATARGSFPDRSIDLLHIDGLHTYEAVREDFETWISAMTDRGVVIFHDINVRDPDFGVWRLWRELSEQYPAFAFDHSNGLGVLAVGQAAPAPLLGLIDAARDPVTAGHVRRLFANAGASLTRRLKLDEARGTMPGAPTRETQRWSEEALLRAGQLSAVKDVVISQLDEKLQTRDAMIRALGRDIDARDAAIIEARERLEAAEAAIAAERTHAQHALNAAHRDAAARQRVIVDQMLRVDAAYRGSASWRLSAPLRALSAVRGRGEGSPVADFLADLARDERAGPPALGVAPPVETVETGAPPAAPNTARQAALTIRRVALDLFLMSDTRLDFTQTGTPDLSVIVVVRDAAELTLGCLQALRGATGEAAVELIVVDNGSTDRTGALLERLVGARVLRQTHNLHYLRAVNLATGVASGRHLLLLNNDAEVLAGSLAACVARLDGDARIGALGGRIILPDGTLQEAGSIIWRDGTCLGFARGRAPDDPDAMFRRDVDYCSGAFLATPRATFERLGGFDERYAPAYYEETDYCVRLHQAGLRVVFDPDVAVLHLEFGSGASEDALALQTRHHGVFRERHALWLRGQHEPRPALAREAANRRTAASRRLLVIEDRLPKPELGAGYPRAQRLVAELVAAGASVTFCPTFRYAESASDIRRVLGPTVRFLADAAADRLRDVLEEYAGAFDAILVCRPHNMRALLDAVGPDRTLLGGVPLIYDAEAVYEGRSLQVLAASGTPVEPGEARDRIATEVALSRSADIVMSVSASELAVFQSHGAHDVRLLGYAIEVAPTPSGFGERDGFAFLGAVYDDNSPNADSLRFFAQSVLPNLRRLTGRPDLRLTVVGMTGAPSIAALDGEAFTLTGMVDEPGDVLDRARVLVVPTRFAAGIPLKVHQAAALGIPVVATRLIADQLGWSDGVELLVGEDGPGLAAACARLHEDAALWNAVRAAALARVEAECSPARFRAEIAGLLEAVPASMRGAGGPEVGTREEPVLYAGRREEADVAVAVPFAYPPPLGEAPGPIAIVCHVFHLDLMAEMHGYFRNVPWPADLLLSTDTQDKHDAIAAEFAGWKGGSLTIRVVPNRGRDIAPMLVGFADIYDRYAMILHTHTKKSLHAPFLAHWRTFLLETLIGSPAVVRSVLEAFAVLPRLGMVVPQHFDAIRRWVSWSGNFAEAQRLLGLMGGTLDPAKALDFPSGSMFWARSAALRPLLDLGLTIESFPPEDAQLDSTVTHAIERLLLHACERSGHDWLKIADPALHMSDRRIVRVGSPDELIRFEAVHGVRLLGADAPPPAGVAPPMVTSVPPGLLRRAQGPRTGGAGTVGEAA
jgi:GT2 family glycosyltransferase